MGSVVKNSSHQTHMFPAEVKQGNGLPSCFSYDTVNKCPFCGLPSSTFFIFLCFFCVCVWREVISLFKISPKCSAEVPSSFSKGKKAVRCLMERMLDANVCVR